MRDGDKAIAMWATPLLLGVPATLMFAITAGSRWARRDGGVTWLE